jgi:uncharacterized membrane protein HdeD (DUF308 family)
MRRILGILVLLGGIVLLVLSANLKKRIQGGKLKIAEAQQQAQQENGSLPLRPIPRARVESAEEQAKQQAMQRGEETSQELSQFEAYVSWFHVGGIVFIILGAGIFCLSWKKKSS